MRILEPLTGAFTAPQVTPEVTPGPRNGKRLGGSHSQPGVFVSLSSWAQQDLNLRLPPCEDWVVPRNH